ncbi:MAG: heparan-alpha-glucosaminide N-acetyltransferase [Clostridia bacterium]|jgi:uncharacterized membrane protein|nr:heparan-alpha-glucosaminide N-acetyltransferase [Clostridia bacterium]
MKQKAARIWELDLIRGIALVLMIYFHVVYDLKELYQYNASYQSGINYYLGKLSGSLFIFVAGISSFLTRSNTKRALKLLAIALLITLATHLYNPAMGIKFGILHFLAVCMLTAPYAGKLRPHRLLLLGTLVIVSATYLTEIQVTHNFFFMFGLTTTSFISSDFYPLIPWYGVFLYGLAAGKHFYREKKSLFTLSPPDNLFLMAGRRTLWVYLLHQPIILLVLSLIFRQ